MQEQADEGYEVNDMGQLDMRIGHVLRGFGQFIDPRTVLIGDRCRVRRHQVASRLDLSPSL